MKLNKIISLFLFLSLLFVISSFKLNAAGGLAWEKGDAIDSATVISGVTWNKYKATSAMDDGTDGRQVVNVTTIAPGAVHFVAWTVLGESTVKMSKITDVIADYESSHPNMKVIAAINDDYFQINTTGNMINPHVMEGVVIKADASSRYFGMGLSDTGNYKLTSRGGSVTVSDEYYLDIYDQSKINILKTIKLDKTNAMPQDGETTAYFKSTENQITNGEGFKLTPANDVKISSDRYFKGSITGRTTVTGQSYATIITTDPEIAALLDGCNPARIYKKVAGEWAEYPNVCGIASQFLLDGKVLTNEEIVDQNVEYIATRAPRTSIGFKPDGTTVFMTIDGRQPTTEMDGVTLRENALALIEEGCTQGFNVDGGGSTTMAVLLNGKMTIVNSPSDGVVRSDSDFILAVVPKNTFELDVNQEILTETDTVTLKGGFNIESLNGFEYVSSEVYVNGKATRQSAEEFVINGLEKGKEYNLCVYLTYYVGKASYTRPFYSENITTIGTNEIKKQPPYEPVIKFVRTENGFNLVFSLKDPTNSVTKVTILNGKTNALVNPVLDTYEVRVVANLKKEYSFTISYTYRLGLNEVYDRTLEYPYTYEYDPEDEPIEFTYKFVVDGVVVKEVKAYPGTMIIAPETPEKEGYEFIGWDKEFFELEKDITINAIFKKIEEDPGKEPEDKPTKPSSSGMSCNFGAYAASMVAGFALVTILLKKKH